MKIRPARRIIGQLRVPGDKSISHRAAIIASLAQGTSSISNFSTSRDCASTLSCLRQLGVSIEQDGDSVRVGGVGTEGFHAPVGTLDCGNSGSTMRMLAGIAAAQNMRVTLAGDESLSRRPMQRIIEPLEMMGARIESQNGNPPLIVAGRRQLQSIKYELPVASAQVKSAVLFAALKTKGRTELIEKHGTRDHTERLLKLFGVPVEVKAMSDSSTATSVEGPAEFLGHDVQVPGDISSAAFLIAAALLLEGSKLEIEDVGLNPTRTQFVQTLGSFGLEVQTSSVHENGGEPLGTVLAQGQLATGARDDSRRSLRSDLIPQLIDELPLLAVMGSQMPGGINIRNARELRFKESDRIAATVNNLRAMGVQVEEFDDGLRVEGATKLHGARLDSLGDHRIAMAFAVAALLAKDDSEIVGAESVNVSFPEFFDLLESVVER